MENNLNNNEEKRCFPRFKMSAQEFREYKQGKITRLVGYVVIMVALSIFTDRIFGWTYLTLLLILTYVIDAKKEKQWIKDGAITKEDLRF
jgi:hypothetical protein